MAAQAVEQQGRRAAHGASCSCTAGSKTQACALAGPQRVVASSARTRPCPPTRPHPPTRSMVAPTARPHPLTLGVGVEVLVLWQGSTRGGTAEGQQQDSSQHQVGLRMHCQVPNCGAPREGMLARAEGRPCCRRPPVPRQWAMLQRLPKEGNAPAAPTTKRAMLWQSRPQRGQRCGSPPPPNTHTHTKGQFPGRPHHKQGPCPCSPPHSKGSSLAVPPHTQKGRAAPTTEQGLAHLRVVSFALGATAAAATAAAAPLLLLVRLRGGANRQLHVRQVTCSSSTSSRASQRWGPGLCAWGPGSMGGPGLCVPGGQDQRGAQRCVCLGPRIKGGPRAVCAWGPGSMGGPGPTPALCPPWMRGASSLSMVLNSTVLPSLVWM